MIYCFHFDSRFRSYLNPDFVPVSVSTPVFVSNLDSELRSGPNLVSRMPFDTQTMFVTKGEFTKFFGNHLKSFTDP